MLDEARELAGLPPMPNGAGKVFRLGAVLVPADKLMDYAEQSLTTPAAPPAALPEPIQLPPEQQPSPPANDDTDDAKEPEEKPQEDDAEDEEKPKPPKKHLVMRYDSKALYLSTAEEKAAYAASMESTRQKYEAQYEKEIASYFKQEHKAVMDAINSSGSRGALAGKVEGVINDQSSKLQKVLLSLYEDVCVDVGGQVASALSGKKGLLSSFLALFGHSQLRYLLTRAAKKVKQVTTTTVAKIRVELADGVVQGESIPQLAKRIDALYLNQIIPNRSVVICRSEVVASSNYASVESAKSSGLTLNKVWLATEDARTRPAHAEADGQEVGMDEKFEVGGEELDYPGDDAGSPENTIQCRCTVYHKRIKSPTDTTEGDSDSSSENDNNDEKRVRRDIYRKFMEEVLV